MTPPEACAIVPQTATGHHHHAVGFAFFCASHQLDWYTPEKLDSILVTYLNQLFVDGASHSEASQAVAVIRRSSPHDLEPRGVHATGAPLATG